MKHIKMKIMQFFITIPRGRFWSKSILLFKSLDFIFIQLSLAIFKNIYINSLF